MTTTKREKTLKWIDKTKSEEKLAKLMAIQDNFDFSTAVNGHYEKSQSDIKSCLRGNRLNKYQKSSHHPLVKSSTNQNKVGDSLNEDSKQDNMYHSEAYKENRKASAKPNKGGSHSDMQVADQSKDSKNN